MNVTELKRIFSIIGTLGFIGGIFYTNMLAHDYLSMTSVFNQYYLEEFMGTDILANDFIIHVTILRLLPIIILMILAYTKFHKVGILAMVMWIGFLWGIYLSVGVVVLGIKGIIICVLGIIPQIFFYIPAYLMVMVYAHQYPVVRWNIGKTLVVILCILCGVVIECNLNPMIMKWFINIL